MLTDQWYIFCSQEAYGGWTSALIWLLVLHSAQREVRERHHYSVDCIVAIYVGILLWRMTGFIWSAKDTSKAKRLAKLDQVQGRLIHAAKDSDIDEVRKLLEEVELAGQERQSSQWAIWAFAGIATTFLFTCVLLAFIWTSDGWFIVHKMLGHASVVLEGFASMLFCCMHKKNMIKLIFRTKLFSW